MIMKELGRYRKEDTRENVKIYCMFWYGYCLFWGAGKSKALRILVLEATANNPETAAE